MNTSDSKAIQMPKSYFVIDSKEMSYVEGGRTKTYYNKAGTLANTFGLCKAAFKAQDYMYASTLAGLNIAGLLPAYICSHNADMYALGESLCKRYSADTYVTATVEYDNIFWISSVNVRKGK